jgi:transposase
MVTTDQPFELSELTLGALPIIRQFMGRLRLEAILERWLAEPDVRALMGAARAIMVLIANLCVAREPLYGIGEWAALHEPAMLGLSAGQATLLSDDRVGRALDELFDCDRGSLLTELVLAAIREFQIDCSQLHNDSTSITLYGEYAQADGRERGGRGTATAARGYSKDHRGDLKQLVSILTVTADGAVPLAYRLADGNTNDDETHIDTWNGLVKLLGTASFLYVADCKLCSRQQMTHIHGHHGRFVTVLPRSRSEDGRLREWMTTAIPDWVEAQRKPGKHLGDPEQVWRVCPAPFPSSEGFHITWVHSTVKERVDERSRAEKIDRARQALGELQARMAGPRARITSRVAAEEAAAATLAASGAERWVSFTITETIEKRYRQEKRGRPSANTRYRELTKTRYQAQVTVNAEQVRYDAASDGCFPLITNDQSITDSDVLGAYRYQPNLEKRHHELKSVQDAAPVTLKSPFRIEALFCCQFIAQLINCLIERQARQAMSRDGIRELPLYHEQRACAAPTATRIYDHFAAVQRHTITSNGQPVQTFPPKLTDLQQQLLRLLDMPETSYTTSTPSRPRPLTMGDG